jgi:uncharacterized hydrophobic protein (TIGR00271 family)
VIHLRIVAPERCAREALDVLEASPAVVNIIHLEGAAHKPDGDVILCDVAREDASVILGDLRALGIHRDGSIAVEIVDTELSDSAREAERAAPGPPSDAVVWEEVEERTLESAELSVSFLAFMVIATLIAAIGVALDQPTLIIGAMVVGPEFGPIAGFCVALVAWRPQLARRSLTALAVGFPLGIAVTYLATLVALATGVAPGSLARDVRPLTGFVSHPDATSVIVAYLAGTAGILSLTSTKSGALVGVLISVTTIPAAGNMGLAAAYGDWSEASGAAAQLGINLGTIFIAGIVTLYLQRLSYLVRRRHHREELARARASPREAPTAAPRPGNAPVSDTGEEIDGRVTDRASRARG